MIREYVSKFVEYRRLAKFKKERDYPFYTVIEQKNRLGESRFLIEKTYAYTREVGYWSITESGKAYGTREEAVAEIFRKLDDTWRDVAREDLDNESK